MIGPDEPRYAAIGREMAVSGDWVTPRLWGETWFEKPALLYWLIGAGNELGLGPDLAPRAPVVVVSLAFLVFFFFQMRREFGERAAWFGCVILATSAGWIAYSHVAVTDLPLAATFSAAILLSLRWIRSGGRRGLIIAGILLGFAVLAKGLVPLVLALPLVWVGRSRWRDLWILGAACLVVAAPWYLVVWQVNGDAFIQEFFWRHHFGRFVSDELRHVQPAWFYVPVLLGLLFPWTPLLFALRGLQWREPRIQLLLTTVLFGFAFFSASTNKLPGYILPLIPPLAALIGIRMAAYAPRVLIAVAAGLLCLIPVAAATLPEAVVEGLSRSEISGFASPLFFIALAAAGVAAKVGPERGFALTAVLMAASVLYIKWQTYPRLDSAASARPYWLTERPDCLDNVHRAIRYGVNYYAGRELPNCSSSRVRRR